MRAQQPRTVCRCSRNATIIDASSDASVTFSGTQDLVSPRYEPLHLREDRLLEADGRLHGEEAVQGGVAGAPASEAQGAARAQAKVGQEVLCLPQVDEHAPPTWRSTWGRSPVDGQSWAVPMASVASSLPNAYLNCVGDKSRRSGVR